MSEQLEMLKEAAISSVQSIQQQYQDSDITVEVGVVVYSDYCDAPNLDAETYRTSQTSACSHIDPTTDYQVVQDFINGLQLSGGGDIPEAVELALHRVNAMSPDFVYMILDAPPHAFVTRSNEKGDRERLYSQSCNDDYEDAKKIPSKLYYLSELAELNESGAIVHCNVCNNAKEDAEAFAMFISNITGGIGIFLKHNDAEKFGEYCSSTVIQSLEERKILNDFIDGNKGGIMQYNPNYLKELLYENKSYREHAKQYSTIYQEENIRVLTDEQACMASDETRLKLELLREGKLSMEHCEGQCYAVMELAREGRGDKNSDKDPEEISTMNCGVRLRKLYEKRYPAESKVPSEVEVHNAAAVTNRPAQPIEVV